MLRTITTLRSVITLIIIIIISVAADDGQENIFGLHHQQTICRCHENKTDVVVCENATAAGNSTSFTTKCLYGKYCYREESFPLEDLPMMCVEPLCYCQSENTYICDNFPDDTPMSCPGSHLVCRNSHHGFFQTHFGHSGCVPKCSCNNPGNFWENRYTCDSPDPSDEDDLCQLCQRVEYCFSEEGCQYRNWTIEGETGLFWKYDTDYYLCNHGLSSNSAGSLSLAAICDECFPNSTCSNSSFSRVRTELSGACTQWEACTEEEFLFGDWKTACGKHGRLKAIGRAVEICQ